MEASSDLPLALTQGYSLMSLTRDGTAHREETDKGFAQVLAVQRTVADENTEWDIHLVPCGIRVGNGSGPELINAPGFNWVL